jgi:hypothetical protein
MEAFMRRSIKKALVVIAICVVTVVILSIQDSRGRCTCGRHPSQVQHDNDEARAKIARDLAEDYAVYRRFMDARHLKDGE